MGGCSASKGQHLATDLRAVTSFYRVKPFATACGSPIEWYMLNDYKLILKHD